MLNGVDVYTGDGVIDWAHTYGSGVAFAFVKASEGIGIHDAKHASNIKNAKAAGLLTGSYHFFLPTSNATDQAKFFIDCVEQDGGFNGQMIPIIDAEKRSGMSITEYSASIQAWLDVVETHIGRKPGIYVNGDY